MILLASEEVCLKGGNHLNVLCDVKNVSSVWLLFARSCMKENNTTVIAKCCIHTHVTDIPLLHAKSDHKLEMFAKSYQEEADII